MSEVVLDGASVTHARTLVAGYMYKHTELEKALRNLLNQS
ncbi:MAG: DUF1731 domain-containing protein [Bacteroidota bacterium]